MVQRYELYLVSLHQSYLICVVLQWILWGRTEVLDAKLLIFYAKKEWHSCTFILKKAKSDKV